MFISIVNNLDQVYSVFIEGVMVLGFRSLLSLFVLGVASASPCFAANFFVAPTGNDSNNGSAQSPWLTLQKAANTVNDGDTVTVAAGNYRGFSMNSSQGGSAGQYIRFLAQPGATINLRSTTYPDGINLEGASYIEINGFTINCACVFTGSGGFTCSQSGITRAGIRAVTNDHTILTKNNIDSCGTWGILTGFSDDLVITDNITSRSKEQHGIYVSNSAARVTISRNISFDNSGCGIHTNGDIESGTDDPDDTGVNEDFLIDGNLIFNNGKNPISNVTGGAAINGDGLQSSVISNNILYNNHASGITLFQGDSAEGSIGNVVVNNTIVQASDGRWAISIGSTSTGNTLRNNILINRHSFRGALTIAQGAQAGLTSDYNMVTSRFSVNDGTSVIPIETWRSTTGQDIHSIIAPAESALFVNPSNTESGDYHLKSGASAIDKGTTSSAPSLDFDEESRAQGSSVDIGADEFVSSGGNPTATPTSTPSATPTTNPTSTATPLPTATPTRTPTSGAPSTPTPTPSPTPVQYKCGGKVATIVGTNIGETIQGTSGNDVIVGLGGNDTIYGRGGNDTICGGVGNDTIYGGNGNDRLYGDAGRDKLFGGGGSNTVVQHRYVRRSGR